MMKRNPIAASLWRPVSWRGFALLFLGCWLGILALIYTVILVLDPYGVVTPLRERVLQYGNQRTLYPQIVRSRRFDSFIVGTSTSRLIDPARLDGPLGGRFANLSMNSMLAWEQKTMLDLVLRDTPKLNALIIGLDAVWCDGSADTHRFLKEGFPDWLYDDSRANDFLHLLNDATVRVAIRQVLYRFGLVKPHVSDNGFGVFVPPDETYHPARASAEIWKGVPRSMPARDSATDSIASERAAMRFPALQWLDDLLGRTPAATRKILAFVPVHIAAQPGQGSAAAVREAECKARIETIARARSAVLIDWRYPSVLTSEDANYWDSLHYRLPVAERVTSQLISAARDGVEARDDSYRILVR